MEPEVFLRLLGRLHPAVVHFPLALILVAAFVEAWLGLRRKERVSRTAVVCLAFGAVLGGVAAWFGWLNAAHEPHGSALVPTIEIHRWTGLGAAGMAIVALLTALLAQLARRRWALVTYRSALLVAAMLVAIGGYFGGELVYGKGYLTSIFRAPPELPTTTPPKTIARASAAGTTVGFGAEIYPILAENCASCHNPDKRRGQLILDPIAFAFAGEPSGWVIQPGDPASSLVIERVRLPADHPDRMPKSGDPLSEEAIALLERWIASGASYDEPAIEAWAGDDPELVTPVVEPLDPAAREAQERVVRAIVARGGIATPLAAGGRELDINLSVADPPASNDDLDLLAGVAADVAWLNLARSGITDAGLARLARFTGLRRLRLEHTAVTDAGLAHLATLSSLTDLNLYGTPVTDAGLETLAGMPGLRTVYLWQTGVTDAGAARLHELRPDLVIEQAATPLETQKEEAEASADAVPATDDST